MVIGGRAGIDNVCVYTLAVYMLLKSAPVGLTVSCRSSEQIEGPGPSLLVTSP